MIVVTIAVITITITITFLVAATVIYRSSIFMFFFSIIFIITLVALVKPS